MKRKEYISISWFLIVLLITPFSTGFSQESLVMPSLTTASPEEKLHALSLTRFHFITLKQFHSALFSDGVQQNMISEREAQILNTALNAFLTSAERETLLLEALRQNRAVRLRFSIPEETDAYEIVPHPTKPMVQRFKPVVRSVPISIDIWPILDQPVAFKITVTRMNEQHSYQVDWAGKISRVSGDPTSRFGEELTSFKRASRAVGISA